MAFQYGFNSSWNQFPSNYSTAFDTVGITGLPSSIRLDEVRDFFRAREGQCSCAVVSGNQYYIAIRFNSPSIAERVVIMYNNAVIFGFKVQVFPHDPLSDIRARAGVFQIAWSPLLQGNVAAQPHNTQLYYSLANRNRQYHTTRSEELANEVSPVWQQQANYANLGYQANEIPGRSDYISSSYNPLGRYYGRGTLKNLGTSFSKAISYNTNNGMKEKKRRNSSSEDQCGDDESEKKKQKRDFRIEVVMGITSNMNKQEYEEMQFGSSMVGTQQYVDENKNGFHGSESETINCNESFAKGKSEDFHQGECHENYLLAKDSYGDFGNSSGKSDSQFPELSDCSKGVASDPGLIGKILDKTNLGVEKLQEVLEQIKKKDSDISEENYESPIGVQGKSLAVECGVAKDLRDGDYIRKKSKNKAPVSVEKKKRTKASKLPKGCKKNSRKKSRKKTGKGSSKVFQASSSSTSTQKQILGKEDFIKLLDFRRGEIEQAYQTECATLLGVVKTLASKDPSLGEKLRGVFGEILMDLGNHLVEKLEVAMERISVV